MTIESKQYEATIAFQQEQLDDARWRMSIAQQFAHMMLRAYEAHLNYGIEYTKLRSYRLWPAFEPPQTFIPLEARHKMGQWITLISKDLDAAVRRKSMHKVIDNKDDPYDGN